ncbi:hypothetical protein CsSME_00001468 [Camellia sinensis var. sinensis]
MPGADLMVRSAKSSMVDELEAMLDVVDPQPPGKSLSRRTFDMPDGLIEKEIAAGVAEVVQMLGRENVGPINRTRNGNEAGRSRGSPSPSPIPDSGNSHRPQS